MKAGRRIIRPAMKSMLLLLLTACNQQGVQQLVSGAGRVDGLSWGGLLLLSVAIFAIGLVSFKVAIWAASALLDYLWRVIRRIFGPNATITKTGLLILIALLVGIALLGFVFYG